MNKQNKELIEVKTKEEKIHKFIEVIKKKWLIDGTKTIMLVAIIIAIFFAINIVMKNLDLTPIDLSQDKLFTLTDESKDKIKEVTKEIKIYFVEYEEEDTTIDLAKQYTKVNDNITVEVVKASDRPDLVQKYGIETGAAGIIVESGEKYKVLDSEELVTFDYSTYETISIAEEKLTAAIMNVTSENVPKIYFLAGYSEVSLSNGLQYLDIYLQNEINEVKEADLLALGKVPDDCETLVIVMPSNDFDEVTTNAIIEYINKGGSILWFDVAKVQNGDTDTPNINKILDLYGIKPFDVGIIRETDPNKMLSSTPYHIIPNIEDTEVTRKLKNSEGIILLGATKINTMEDEALDERKVEKTELIKTSESSYFETSFDDSSNELQEEEKASYIVGQMMTKTISEANEETGEAAKVSKLIIYGESGFISDFPLSQSSYEPAIRYRQNRDLALNSIAYLSDREENIITRKRTGTVTYTATETENSIILTIIFTVPVVIIVAGIVIWVIRRRKK